MAKTYIAEYADVRAGRLYGLIAEQTALTNTTASQTSAAFDDNTKFITVASDGIISYKMGKTPVVTIANSMRQTAGRPFELAVEPGEQIAIIINT
jgi:hypothetical protein